MERSRGLMRTSSGSQWVTRHARGDWLIAKREREKWKEKLANTRQPWNFQALMLFRQCVSIRKSGHLFRAFQNTVGRPRLDRTEAGFHTVRGAFQVGVLGRRSFSVRRGDRRVSAARDAVACGRNPNVRP